MTSDQKKREEILAQFRAVFPYIASTLPEDMTFLGAPKGQKSEISAVEAKLGDLKRICHRLETLPAHVAFFLLKNCFYIPKLLYMFRTAPVNRKLYESTKFDTEIRQTLERIFNIEINDPRWEFLSLPCKLGGVGIQQAQKLAISAYLSSLCGSLDLCDQIHRSQNAYADQITWSLEAWKLNVSEHSEVPPRLSVQRKMPMPLLQYQASQFIEKNPEENTRLQGLMCPGAGDWLNALPSLALCLQLDDEEFRIAMGFRLGAPVCTTNKCSCGEMVDALGKHSLVCKKSRSVHARHSMGNHVIHRSMIQADISSTLELTGLFRTDSKRPDGLTVDPWANGRPLLWDFTCVHRLADSYRQLAKNEGPCVADAAEDKKGTKYIGLVSSHIVQPVAFETLGGNGD